MDEKLIEVATELKAHRRLARRIGVTSGFAAIATPFLVFGIMPLGGVGGSGNRALTDLLSSLLVGLTYSAPALIGVGFALMNVGLGLRKREEWLKDQAKIESPSATQDFRVRRRRDARILLAVSLGILAIEGAALWGLSLMQQEISAWDHAQKGPLYLNSPLSGTYMGLWMLDAVTAPLLLAIATVLLASGVAVLVKNRASLFAKPAGADHDRSGVE